MTPSPALLTGLMRSRLSVRHARATMGVGERPSHRKGAGMEFSDYREYQPGDDMRRLDPHLHARTGEYFVREYATYQQLPVSIIVDGSASMKVGEPAKFEFACTLAAALAHVALAGGDAVEIGVHAREKLAWSPQARSVGQVRMIFEWIATRRASGTGFGAALGEALVRLSHRGLLIVLSDWWDVDAEGVLAALRQELVAVQILSPQEIDPTALGSGELRLVDAESFHETELSLDPAVLAAYEAALADCQRRLRSQIVKRRGRYFPVRSDADLDYVLLHEWRRLDLIR